ncbi:hypothetical protein KUCAC02_014738, partial [Chaenocephalus aceratus]
HPLRAVESPEAKLALSPTRYLQLNPDNFYYLQITGSVTQLPSEAPGPLNIDRVSRGQRPGQGQTTTERSLYKERCRTYVQFASPPLDLEAKERSHSELLPGRLVGLRWSFQGMTALATAISDALTLF